jgi:prepilin-type N-terminal cleavage/methylation domain-containing protein
VTKDEGKHFDGITGEMILNSGKWHHPGGLTDQRGFSLIDLVMVIIILGILSTIAIPQLHSMISESKLNGATGEVVSALQYAQSLAVKHQRVFGVRLIPNDNAISVIDYRYRDDATAHMDADPPVEKNGIVFNPFDKNPFLRDFDNLKEYEGVQVTFPSGVEYVCFYADGHSSDTDRTISLSFEQGRRTVTVDGTIGRITVK